MRKTQTRALAATSSSFSVRRIATTCASAACRRSTSTRRRSATCTSIARVSDARGRARVRAQSASARAPAVVGELLDTGAFELLPRDVDEAEHSIEMQLPYLAHCCRQRRPAARIVPIMVGSMSDTAHRACAELLLAHFRSPRTLFVISSDFCHWGARFDYRPAVDDRRRPIHESIAALDREAIDIIESGSSVCMRAHVAALLTPRQATRKNLASTCARPKTRFAEDIRLPFCSM